MNNFSRLVIQWFAQHGRKHLPWQQNPSPYEVWVSEIMLQQTQVNTVIPYYERFMNRFPTVASLASATVDEVLHHWAGLGYYARGRHLHHTAQLVMQNHQGEFPNTLEGLTGLPGIGRSTAGAILSLGHHQRATILDGNVKRVLARVHAIDSWPDDRQTLKKMWVLAESLTPEKNVEAYNQAMMDLGALLCVRGKPHCERCPLTGHCQAYARGETDRFPVSKPKKIIPEKFANMVAMIREDGAVLLAKRPSPGIWGGLWCFPEEDKLPAVQAFSKHELGVSRHVFTHYRWTITLQAWKVPDSGLTSPDFLWYTVDAQPLGLAAVVKRYLPQIRNHNT